MKFLIYYGAAASAASFGLLAGVVLAEVRERWFR
jgi:hypothetical protein